jgi:hypothetical protein
MVINLHKEDVNTRACSPLLWQRMRELEVRKGKGRRSVLQGKARRAYSQLTGTVSVATLRWLLERRAEQLWECLVCIEADS